MSKEIVINALAAHYGAADAKVFAAPGRINLIGEHTDYNGGYVFPGAIDKGITAAIRLNGSDRIRALAIDLNEQAEFGLQEEDAPTQQWARYIFGISRELIKRGLPVGGFDTAFTGDVPLGAGMSSSAALESVYAFALNQLLDGHLDKLELARAGQATEHNYCGVKCGIMDQFASLFGKAGNLILLNCHSMEYHYYPFHPEGYRLVLLDTQVKHELASSAYNKRRQSCEAVVAAVQKRHKDIAFLCDVTFDMLHEIRDEISAEEFRCAQYVVGETARVKNVCTALELGDYETVGQMMYETHYGMSHLYEVSCRELDSLNDMAKACGVAGSRVMGGGFGGCTLNLVQESLYDAFISSVNTKYFEQYGKTPKVYEVVISDGARELC
ncbi:MAG: galactokinase [Prevotellaceae bacterium]|jgi:galactokinase|nr:galactokinase [Prevotellaceae bacterium]